MFTFVSQVVLLGVLGHFESAPSVSNINIADSLFMASLAIVGFQLIIATSPVAYFGHQFLAIVTDSLQELEKVSTDGDEPTTQIKLMIGKVAPFSPSLSFSHLVFSKDLRSVDPEDG